MPPVKAEPGAASAASVKSENGRAGSAAAQRARPANGNARSNLKAEEDKKDLPPPPPTTYRDIPLLSTNCGQWLTHLMKFAHHTRVDPTDAAQFIPPLKLNRKNPPRLKLPRPNPGDPITDKYNRPMMGKDGQPLTWPGPDDDLGRIEEVIKKEVAAKGPGADQSLIAPGGSARPPKSKLFKKKVREIHKAADSARKTMKEEHFPWVLEDFETSEEWESIRTPIPTGARALQEHIDQLKAKASGSNTDGNADVKMQDAKTTVKSESGIKQESGASAATSSSTSHAPWIGKLEGDSSSEASSLHVLFVFDERDAGGFKVVPVSRMYKFLQKPKHSTMTNEQVEQEYQKYQKTKEMDRWALRNKPIAAGNAVTKQEDSAAWRNWPQVNRLSLPTGMSFDAGRRRNLMAVHGGELLRDDDDDDASRPRRRKREDSPGAGYDELDFEEEFADDEETHDPEADVVDDEEAKELEERLKREMARASNMGDDEDGGEEESAPEDEDQMLTGSGKQMMKIMRALAKREGNEAYEKDDDGRNPYATDESEEDEEESYVANPEKAIQLAREERDKKEKEAAKNKGKSTPGTASGSNTPTDRAEKKPVTLVSNNSSSSQPQQRPGAGHASLAQRATSPTRGASKIGSKQVSRSSSPSLARSVSPGRAESPPAGSDAAAIAGSGSGSSGLKRRADSPATPTSSGAAGAGASAGAHRPEAKRVKTASSGSRAGSPGGSPPGSKPGSRAGSPGAPRVPANAVEAEIIQLIREGKIANTSELVQHFRKRLKSEPHIKDQLSAAVRKVAVMDKATNRLKLKDGF